MRQFLATIAKIRADLSRELNKIPVWQEVVRMAAMVCSPITAFARGLLDAFPALRRLEWLLEIESLTRRNPLLLLFTLAYVLWRGLRTTNLGHIGTDPIIYPFIAAVSGFNPFLGILCGVAYGIGDVMQKLVVPDIYGAARWGDSNYWSAIGGYIVAYSSLMFMGVFPGMLSRVLRLTARVAMRKFTYRQASAAADGATPLNAGTYPLAELIAGIVGGFAGGYLSMEAVAPVAERPAFLWRPRPDISCHRLEVDSLLKGRAHIGGSGGGIGGVITTIAPPGGPPVPGGPPPDVEWTGPDGVTRVLQWSPEHNGYINILTGGLVDPNHIEGWKQNIRDTLQQTEDWRTRNQQLEAAGLDAQSQALAAIQQDAANRAAILGALSKIEHSVLFGGAASDLLQAPGTPGNILDNIDKLAGQIASGNPIDYNKLNAISKLYNTAAKGNFLSADKMPQPGDADRGVLMETLKATWKEVATCSNQDGLSVKGFAVQAGLAILTGGLSEIPIAIQTMKDYVDGGGNSIAGGFAKGVESVILGEILGAGLGKVAHGAGALGKAVGAAVGEVAPGLTKSVLKPIANGLGNMKTILTTEIRMPVSGGGGVADALGTTGKVEGKAVTGALGEGAGVRTTGAEPPAVTKPPAPEPPVTSEPLVTTEPPVTVEPPVTTRPPVTTEPPVTTKSPVATEPPLTTEPPVTTKPPATAESPVTAEPSPAPKPPDAAEPPTTKSPDAAEPPATEAPPGEPIELKPLDATSHAGQEGWSIEAINRMKDNVIEIRSKGGTYQPVTDVGAVDIPPRGSEVKIMRSKITGEVADVQFGPDIPPAHREGLKARILSELKNRPVTGPSPAPSTPDFPTEPTIYDLD